MFSARTCTAGPWRLVSASRPPPGFDGVELVVIADDDRLGAADVGCGEELEHRLVVGHARFVDQQHGAPVEGELLVFGRQTSDAIVQASTPASL